MQNNIQEIGGVGGGGGGGNDGTYRCRQCRKTVCKLNRIVINGFVWHLGCFKCTKCNDTLSSELDRNQVSSRCPKTCHGPSWRESGWNGDDHKTTAITTDPTTNKIGCTPQMYPRRLGTYDTGKEYETKMVALLALRCVSLQDTEDVWLANNLDGVGDFDDIVLYRRATDGRITVYMLQIKHQSNPTTIETRDFVRAAGKKSFCLTKYNRCYEALRNKIETCEDAVFETLRNADKIVYVLYTNKTVGRSDFLVVEDDNDLKFLDTSDSDGNVYKFVENPHHVSQHGHFLAGLNPNFLRQLVIFSDQSHIGDMSRSIKETIRKLIRCDDPRMSFDRVAKLFVSFVKMWARDGLQTSSRDHYALTRCDVIDKLMQITLGPYRLRSIDDHLTSSHHKNHQNNQDWTEIIQGKPVTVVESNETVLHFLKNNIRHEVSKFCDGTWTGLLPQQISTRFLTDPRYKMLHSKMFGFKKKLTLVNAYELLWIDEKIPLLLQVDTERDYRIILDVLESFQYCLPVVMLVEGFSPDVTRRPVHFHNLTNLNASHQELILNQTVLLQGRRLFTLRELVDGSMYDSIRVRDIVEILCGTFSVGNAGPSLPSYFVERHSVEITDFSGAHLICDGPGTGKSVYLNYLARNAPVDTWVLKVDLNEHRHYYEDSNKNKNDNILEYFVDYSLEKEGYRNNKRLAKLLYRKMVAGKKLLVLLDGFDEVAALCYESEALKVVERFRDVAYGLWITARPIVKPLLEARLDTKAVTLEPFRQGQQRRFLTRYFAGTCVENTQQTSLANLFAETILEKIGDSEFLGVPFHMEVLAEMFSAEFEFCTRTGTVTPHTFDKFDLYGFYERLITKKMELLSVKYGEDAVRTRRAFSARHQQLFALKSLFGSRPDVKHELKRYCTNKDRELHFLQRDGIVTVEPSPQGQGGGTFKVGFFHRTFAEYLAAQWLTDNLTNSDLQVKQTAESVLGLRFQAPYSSYKLLYETCDRFLTSLSSDDENKRKNYGGGCGLERAILQSGTRRKHNQTVNKRRRTDGVRFIDGNNRERKLLRVERITYENSGTICHY